MAADTAVNPGVGQPVIRTGFIAQEVEAAANEVGFDFDGIDRPANEGDLYGLRYAEFVVPLVKAVQEQQEHIRQLQDAQQLQSQKMQHLEALIQKLSK